MPLPASAAEVQLALVASARRAGDRVEADFIAVNDSHLLAPYRQAVLWLKAGGVTALSGVASVERNAPYVLWLEAACAVFAGKASRAVGSDALPPRLAEEWPEWLPEFGLWIRLSLPGAEDAPGGMLFARDTPWSEDEARQLEEWLAHWVLVRHALAPFGRKGRLKRALERLKENRRQAIGALAVVAVVLLFPVRISVLAPGELVPSEPIAIRAPIDGVVSQFLVRPNQRVRAGEPLFAFDALQLSSRLEVATQALRTAEAELRQYDQQSFTEAKARAALAAARGNVAERSAEVGLLREQHGRTQVLAPEDGIAIFDDPQEWIGKPATTGDRILRLASEKDKEIEAWVPVGDAIPLKEGAEARLYVSASPLSPVPGAVRYYAYEAVRRPDGVYAFRVRARLEAATEHRIGLKGTVRLSGDRVPFVYWMMRRPLAAVREFLGL